MSALEEISDTLKDIAKNQQDTKSALWAASDHIVKEENNVLTVMCDRGFADKYGMELPMKELRDFQLFDEKLKLDENTRRDFIASLPTLIDRHNIVSKSTTNILRKFMTRSVVLKFTVQKKITDKIVLKDTTFCKCALEVLLNMHRDNRGDPITEKDVFGAFGSSLNNAKDWDGYRSQRKDKEKKNN